MSRIEMRRDAEVSILDKLIEKARELAIEVKERTVAVAQDVADRMEQFRDRFERWREQRGATNTNAPFTVLHQGVSFFGNFASGTPLLYNSGNGPDLIGFTQPVTEFGVTAERNVLASHNYTVTFLSGTTPTLAYTFSDDDLNTFFVGAQATNGSTFNGVLTTGDDNDFALGPVRFSTAANVPEPASWLLGGIGVALLILLRFRNRAQA